MIFMCRWQRYSCSILITEGRTRGVLPVSLDTDSLRKSIAALCRRKAARDLGHPHDWRPESVRDPHTGECFTGPGAWEFIADLGEAGADMEVVILDNPPGKKGYVLHPAGGEGQPDIYIKVQLLGQVILGRSFHYTKYPS